MNARTGSVVMNQAVTLDACAVSHGNLSVTINTQPVISQPAPFSGWTDRRGAAVADRNQQGSGQGHLC
jgi:flagellar basal body P-ring protein FlgI